MPALIETAIGLALLYFLVSLLVGAIVEYISAVFKMRARVLRDALTTILGDARIVLDHPLVKPTQPHRSNSTWFDKLSRLFQRGISDPSYVHPRLMAQALMSPTAAKPATTGAAKLLAAIKQLPTVQAARAAAQGELEITQQELERWFDEAMKRWSGVYTRQSQAVSLLVSLILVPAMNIDTVRLTRLLWNSPEVRMALATQASAVLASQTDDPSKLGGATSGSAIEPVELAQQAIDDLDLPLGWPEGVTLQRIISGLLGWLISVIAVAAGSRFWFGTLNRLTNMRLTGPPPESMATRGT